MYRETIPVGGMSVVIGALCPDDGLRYGCQSLSLKKIQTQEDAKNDDPLVKGLLAAFNRMGVRQAFAPNVVPSSARIVDTSVLRDRISIGKDIFIYRHNATPADGVFIGRDHAFVMSSGGCPVIIAVGGEQMIVAHASRDSLIDRGAVMGTPSRNHVSVVESIVDEFLERGVPIDGIVMRMVFSIPTAVFEHRLDDIRHGASYNRMLLKFIKGKGWAGSVTCINQSMFLDLETLFEEQATMAGISHALASHSLADHPALAHTRDGKGRDRRNLFIFKRNQN